jgi:hypothetical protein
VGVFFCRRALQVFTALPEKAAAEKIICCCSLRLEKNYEPLAVENLPAAGKLKLSFPLAWPGSADSPKTFCGMNLTMSGLSLILEVSSQRGLNKRRS